MFWIKDVLVPVLIALVAGMAAYFGAKTEIKNYLCEQNTNGGDVTVAAGNGGSGGNGGSMSFTGGTIRGGDAVGERNCP